jgi:serine/threonine protein kinase
MQLKSKTIIHLTNGQSARVIQLLGKGGQGEVYLVDLNGKQMALKWYTNPDYISNTPFYRNLATNIRMGKPSNLFLWPEYLTLPEYGSFGYLMPLRPERFVDFSQFLLAKVRFHSWNALFYAAIQICEAFKSLHIKGLSYQDLNDGNFFIDPHTGEMLICDNDNVIFSGANLGIAGKTRYMAPEVVAGKSPDTYSDRFSLTVILFLLLYGNHPFEGEKVLSQPCMREADERKFFGSQMLFIYDPNNCSNRPSPKVHTNVIRRWEALPKCLRDQFVTEFSADKLYTNPQSRLIEAEWIRLLQQAQHLLIVCPHCSKPIFLQDLSDSRCSECSKVIPVKARLMLDRFHVPLVVANRYQLADDICFETVLSSTDNLLWLRNTGKCTWQVTTTKGEQRPLATKALMPAKKSIQIQFNNKLKGEID